MRTLLLLSALALASACSDDSAAGGGNGGAPGSGGAPAIGGMGGAAAGGGGGAGGAGGESPSKRVFLSSTTHDGNLGGITGGDAECQALADAAELGGTWMAWLSESGAQSPLTRFTQSEDPYVLVGGAPIAADWAALIDGTLDAPINRDETGAEVSDEFPDVWTGTGAGGEATFSPCCTNWTSADSGSAFGVHSATDATWSFSGGHTCTVLSHLYCFEQ